MRHEADMAPPSAIDDNRTYPERLAAQIAELQRQHGLELAALQTEIEHLREDVARLTGQRGVL